MNKVTLIGRLTKDPEVRYSTGENATAICKFTLAIDDGFGEKKRTSFIPVTVFGKTAENCEKYLGKGKQVAINGKIQTGSYEKDGRTIYTTDVIADTYGGVEFVGNGQSADNTQKSRQNEPQGFSEGEQTGFTALRDDDMPF